MGIHVWGQPVAVGIIAARYPRPEEDAYRDTMVGRVWRMKQGEQEEVEVKVVEDVITSASPYS